MVTFLRLTSRQQKFLLQIVEGHDRTGGSAEFSFLETKPRSGLTYSRAVGYFAEGDITDLTRLRSEGLVDFRRLSQNQYAGGPTQLGIDAVREAVATSQSVPGGTSHADVGNETGSRAGR